MTPGLVSIIIPHFNREELVKETILSALNQEYSPIEIIIIDDNSTEESFKSLQNFVYSQKSKITIKLLKNQKKGAQAARNLGYQKSQGEFIQFLDSDDVLLSNKLIDEVLILRENQTLDLVYSKCQFFDEIGLKPEYWGRKLDGTHLDYFEFSWQTMCAIYRKTFLEKVGLWNEELIINQDWEFSIRCILEGANCHFIPHVHSHIRAHSGESIGKGLTEKKIDGKLAATNAIFQKTKEKNLLNKRPSSFDKSEKILQQKKAIFPYILSKFLMIKSSFIARLIFKLYKPLN